MDRRTLLKIDGEVADCLDLTFDDLAAIEGDDQIPDVSQFDDARQGSAVRLEKLVSMAGPKPSARYLGLHATKDDFHASVPLAPILDRGLVIYTVDGEPLPETAGGPVRFLIPNFAACHTDEIDECANVKFVDRIELQATKGFDNRPADDDQHEALHREQQS